LLWFLRGDTNIKFLVDNDCHIWDGDCYKSYEKAFNEGKVGGLSPMVKGVADKIIPKELFIDMIENCDELGSGEFAKKWGNLGPIYGAQWRGWKHMGPKPQKEMLDDNTNWPWKITEIDQIANAINDLKTNPDSRRIIVSAWNPANIESAVLPPCHYGFQVYTRELSLEDRIQFYYKRDCGNGKSMPDKILKEELKSERTVKMLDKLNIPTRAISLMWNQRSVDSFLGLPFNIASYGLLLEIIAKAVNMVPDELIGNLGDTHLYSNHIEQAKEQIGRFYTHEERTEMLKNTMGESEYKNAVSDIAAFSGGLSEYYDSYKIPKRTRQPYPLPTLKINSGNENWDLLEIDEIINSLDPDITFKVENYQSHSTIKAPLSN
jgi:thymidylate synthase